MIGKIINQFIFQFGNYVLPFIIIPFLINKLSLHVYKDFVVIQTLVIFFAVLVNYGLDLFGVRYISSQKQNKSNCKEFVLTSLICRFSIFIIVSFFLYASLYYLTAKNIFYWGLCFFWLSSFIFQLNWYFQGIGDFKSITYYGLLPKAGLYPLVFVLVENDQDAWVYLLLCALANYFTNISMLCHILFKLAGIKVKVDELFKKIVTFLASGWYIFFSQASVTLISYANVFFLPLLLDTKNYVVFSTADRIVKVLSIATTPVLNVLFPHISSLILIDKNKAFSLINKTLFLSLMIFFLGYIFYSFFGFTLTEMLFPKIAKELHDTLFFLLLNVIFVFANNLYGTQIGLNCGKDKAFSIIIALNGAASLILMALSSYYFGLKGVIFSSLCVQISILLCMFFLAKRCGYKLGIK